MVLPPRFSKRILAVSFLSLGSAAVAFFRGIHDCALVALLVFVNSANYWRRPLRGMRRWFDMLTAFGGCAYQISRAFSSRTQPYFMLFVVCGAGCYACARRCKSRDISSLWHCGIHVFGNIGNLALYYGLTNGAKAVPEG